MAKQNNGLEEISKGMTAQELRFYLAYLIVTTNQIRSKMADLQAQLDNIEAKLDEASKEILAEIAKLQSEQLTPDGVASLGRIEARAVAMADIAPPVEPVP